VARQLGRHDGDLEIDVGCQGFRPQTQVGRRTRGIVNSWADPFVFNRFGPVAAGRGKEDLPAKTARQER
jgi:hypothetical protein